MLTCSNHEIGKPLEQFFATLFLFQCHFPGPCSVHPLKSCCQLSDVAHFQPLGFFCQPFLAKLADYVMVPENALNYHQTEKFSFSVPVLIFVAHFINCSQRALKFENVQRQAICIFRSSANFLNFSSTEIFLLDKSPFSMIKLSSSKLL